MKKNVMISIIVPVYNVPENMLKKCLTSLKNQTYKNVEIIIVDDGSTDRISSKICDSYNIYNNFYVYHKLNGGLCDARNFGVSKAKGDFITFVDGDDYLDNSILERVVNDSNFECDIICFGTVKEYRNSCYKYTFGHMFDNKRIYSNRFDLLKLLLNFNSEIGDSTAKLYKRDFLNKNQIEHNSTLRQGIESIEFNFRCFEKLSALQLLYDYGYYYTYNPSSITLKQDDKSILQIKKGVFEVFKLINNSEYSSKLLLDFYERVNYITVTTAISGIFSIKGISYKSKKIMLKNFISDDIIKKSLDFNIKMDLKRRIIIKMIKHSIYFPLLLLSYIRKIQKEF